MNNTQLQKGTSDLQIHSFKLHNTMQVEQTCDEKVYIQKFWLPIFNLQK